MARTAKSPSQSLGRPGLSVESREGQLVSLAYDEAEKRIRNGTATSQLLTHFLKLGTSLAELSKEKLRNENQLLEAKTSKINSEKNSEELYSKALKAFGIYRGEDDSEDYEEDYDDYDY